MKLSRLLFIFVFFCKICGTVHSANPENSVFNSFKLNNELPTKTITNIYCDREGSIWFATPDGLIRYDGQRLKTFRSTSNTPGKLISNEIVSLTADRFDRLWLGTDEGVMVIDPHGFSISQPNIMPIKSQRINSMITDHEGMIWISTTSNGVVKVNPSSMDFEQYTAHSSSTFKLRSNDARGLYEDSNNRIWISTWKEGLSLISADRRSITYLPQVGNTDNAVRVFEDKDGLIWIGTWGDGLFYVHESDAGNIQFKRFNIAESSTAQLGSIVYGIDQDPYFGYVWFTTYKGLVCSKKNTDGSITLMQTDLFFKDKLKKTINNVCIDKSGNLWLGSMAEGAYHMTFQKNGITNINLSDPENHISQPPHINKVCEIPGNDLLIAVDRAGPFWFDLKTGKIRKTNNEFLNSFKSVGAFLYVKRSQELWLSHLGQDKVYAFKVVGEKFGNPTDFTLSILPKAKENSINQMFEDSKENIWFATRNGLYFKQPDRKSIKVNSTLKDIISFAEDKHHNVWVGTLRDGLFRLKKTERNDIFKFENVPLVIDKHECVTIESLFTASSGLIYAGTSEGCLFVIDPIRLIVNEISSKYGITENAILDILEDKFGDLLLMTKINLLRFNPKTKITSKFEEQESASNDFFFKNAACKLTNGNLIFGGNKGLSMVEVKKNEEKPRIISKNVSITDVYVNSKSIFDFKQPLNYKSKSKHLILKHDQNSILLTYSAFNYLTDTHIRYAYMLKGLDKDWQYGVVNQNQVNYSGLTYGNYTFLVKASDSDGIWRKDATSLKITILPPYYLSWYAKMFYLLVLLVVLFIIYKVYINKLKIQNALTISQIEHTKSEELTQIKLQYFTNISHELLTPLSIISLQIEKLHSLKQIDTRHFQLIKDNIFRLKKLASQILLFKKVESGNLKLTVSKKCIVQFIKNIVEVDFKPQFEEKHIRFSFSSALNSYPCYFDADKIEKIIFNLVSNACKFTPAKGNIHLSINFEKLENEDFVQITLQDSGCGIDSTELSKIFNRFYIGKSSDPSQSHGIGLSLTKELVELHKGQINVSSVLNVGTTFIIRFPVSISSFSEDELLIEEKPAPIEAIVPDNLTPSVTKSTLSTKDFTILIVEDNFELRTLMTAHFNDKFAVLSAVNGVEALSHLRNNSIDLVITDLLMPQMDGLTLCKTIRSISEINHVNILVLTAKNNPEDRIDCYNAGADGYISKPFEMDVLEARVFNLYEKRKQVIESFRINFSSDIESLSYNPIDQAFINNAIEVIREHIEEEDLDLERFANLLKSSKSTLHRKFTYLTGLSPCEFIKNYKLKYARELMTTRIGYVSEVAYSVGFSCPKYFSRCFKIEFGMTPTEYKESIWKEIEK